MDNVTLARLEDQIKWYNERSRFSKRWYLRLRIGATICAALVPVASSTNHTYIASGLGVGIVILEGILQLNGFHEHWTSYRSTCEMLKHEKYLYSASAGPYRNDSEALTTLAERVEELVSTEHAKWVNTESRNRHLNGSGPSS